jgi:hypothetical protein
MSSRTQAAHRTPSRRSFFRRARGRLACPILISLLAIACGPIEGDFLEFDLPPPEYTTPDATLIASDASRDQRFGYALALDGDLAFVGAYRDDAGSGANGAVYVFQRDALDPTVWTESKKIVAPDAEANDQFGRSLAQSGGILAVGVARDDDACPSIPNCNSGAVWLFGRDVGGIDNWGPIAKILPGDSAGDQSFGYSVAIKGTTLVVGAPDDDAACVANPNCDSGAYYVFERDQGGVDAWGEVLKQVASDSLTQAWFGSTLALASDTLVVGAPYDARSCTPGPYCWFGATYVFGRDVGGVGTWGEVARVVPPILRLGDAFGNDVALEGDVMIVGAPGEDIACPSSPNCNSGAVHVFERDLGGADNWGHRVRVHPSDTHAYQEFGLRVALSGSRLASGAWGDGEAGRYAGAAYVYERDLGGVDTWGELDKLIADGVRDGDFEGVDVALEAQTLAVGAIGLDTACPSDTGCDSGGVFVFTIP